MKKLLLCISALLLITCTNEPLLIEQHIVTMECQDLPGWHLDQLHAKALWKKYGRGKGKHIAVMDWNFAKVESIHDTLSKDFQLGQLVAIINDEEITIDTPFKIVENRGSYSVSSSHGVACAGLISSSITGIAPESTMTYIRPAGSSDDNMLQALLYADSIGVEIVSLSIGSWSHSPSPSLTRFLDTTDLIIIAAAGNYTDRKNGEIYNNIGIASHENVITAVAFGMDEEIANYSQLSINKRNYGVLIGNNIIYTTDLNGDAGKYPGNFMPDFGGTSAAAPLIAGLIALVGSEEGFKKYTLSKAGDGYVEEYLLIKTSNHGL